MVKFGCDFPQFSLRSQINYMLNATPFLREVEIAKGSTPAFMQHLFHAVNYVLVLAPPLLHVTWSVSIVSWRAKRLTSSFLAGAFWHFTSVASASLTFITSKSFKLDFIGADARFNPRETGQQKHPANWANSNLSASKPDTIAESGGFLLARQKAMLHQRTRCLFPEPQKVQFQILAYFCLSHPFL